MRANLLYQLVMNANHSKIHCFRAADDEHKMRLDRFLALRLQDVSEMSRARVKSLIQEGHAYQSEHAQCASAEAEEGEGDKPEKNKPHAAEHIAHIICAQNRVQEPNRAVKSGWTYCIQIPEAAPADPLPENIALDILYEDDDLIVINKPAGLVVHPGAGNSSGTLVNALLYHCGDSLSGIGGVKRPGIVHRLDKDTSGVMVVAKNDLAHHRLARQFADHGRKGPLERRYHAFVWGTPKRSRDVITTQIDRKPNNRLKMAVVAKGGREAITHYQTLKTYGAADAPALAAKVECRLETGRTHQIRVHMAHIGNPLMGDETYATGFKSKISTLNEEVSKALLACSRQALHASVLGFSHPQTGEALFFESPAPPDLAQLEKALETQ